MRPAPRTTSSGRYNEEQPSRPMRPRLSRDTVDRAWENGANRKYADYRSRPDTRAPHDQRQGRPSPRFERSRPPYEQREYERRESEPRPYERRQGGYGAPSSFDHTRAPRQRRFDEEPPRHSQEPGYRTPGNRPPSGEHWNRSAPPRREGERTGYRERYQDERPPRYPYSARGPFAENDSRAPHPAGRHFDRPAARYPHDRPGQDTRPFERNEQAREHFAQDRRNGAAPYPPRDTSPPRWQNRPAAQQQDFRQRDRQREYRHERPPFQQTRRYTRPRPEGAQFEGDYEHFAIDEQREREQAHKPQVTQLPDGRVLKGSPPAQHKAARFWTDVEAETNSLLSPTPGKPAEQAPAAPAEQMPEHEPASARPQPEHQGGRVKMVKTTHASNQEEGKARAGKKKGQAHNPVIYPSQRGYKWPAAGE